MKILIIHFLFRGSTITIYLSSVLKMRIQKWEPLSSAQTLSVQHISTAQGPHLFQHPKSLSSTPKSLSSTPLSSTHTQFKNMWNWKSFGPLKYLLDNIFWFYYHIRKRPFSLNPSQTRWIENLWFLGLNVIGHEIFNGLLFYAVDPWLRETAQLGTLNVRENLISLFWK